MRYRSSLVLLAVLVMLPASVYATPKIHQWTLDNGAKVLFVESHQLPIVQVNLAFNAGSARDPSDRHGVALMTNHMLNQGTKNRTAQDIARQFESVGAEFSTDVDRDMATLSLRSLSDEDKLNRSVELFASIVAQPSFPKNSFDRERERLRVGLQTKKQSPGDIANDLFFDLTFGNHPYAHSPEGNEMHLDAMQRDHLAEFHRQYYVGRNAVLAIMGDLEKSDARRLARQLVGRLPAGKTAPTLPEVKSPGESRTRKLSFDSEQSHILVGQVGMHRKDPDYFSLYLGNYILGGGGLVSRLSEEVREKNGLAYSVYSYFWPMARRGPFIMGLQTRNDHRDRALKLVHEVLEDFIERGPTADELAAAKSHITGGFALRIDTSQKIAGYLTVIGFYDLPLTYLDDFPGKIESLTAKDIRDAFQRRIKPQQLTTVVVGGGR